MTTAVWLSVCANAAAQPQSARERYESAIEREAHVRALLTAETPTPPTQLAAQVTQVMTAFESVVRRFPTSGYADNALFQAAALADAAYARLKDEEHRDRAVRLYHWLIKEYPTSSLVNKANSNLALLAADPKPAAAATTRATLLKIERVALRDVVRITVELDREVEYVEQTLTGPARVFFDLRNVQAVPELRDKVLSYSSDVVSKIRIGRHPDSVVRVVLDLEDVAKHSVFALYNPFRIVVDAERTPARAAALFPPLLPATPFSVSSMFGAMPRAAFVIPERPDIPLAPEPLAATGPLILPLPRRVIASSPPPKGGGYTPNPVVPTTPSTNAAGGFSIARQLGLSVSRIVIDPGHGGHDPGVLGKGLNEATLVLDVALRLEKLLQKDAGVEVVLTRRTDVYVPLEERTEIANRQNADMFLSIHANASRNEDARGIETFFLSFASSPDAEAVAARENSASARDMHQLPDLVKAITLNNKLDESRDLATMVQDALVSNLRKSHKDIRSRGVKKAPFVVLIGAAMPSVLAEISFVSNTRELALLKTPAYRQKIAEALYAAVTKYRRSLKNQTLTALPER
ncbi:MAG TPA: N-acetylmuramoyl-L-alanine amidase [Vicinamibacterales bacterium]|nr:N-acetylmuramoyl-L-alanine amidase [Vicinamibacterales bacterium]